MRDTTGREPHIQSCKNPGSVVAMLQGIFFFLNHEFQEISEKKCTVLSRLEKMSAWLFSILHLLYVKEVCFSYPMNKNKNISFKNKKLAKQTTPKEHSLLYFLYLMKKYLNNFLFQPIHFFNFLVMPKFPYYIFLFPKFIPKHPN